MNPDGAVMLLNYREDGVTPYFTVFKDGLKTIKLVSFFLLMYSICQLLVDDVNLCPFTVLC